MLLESTPISPPPLPDGWQLSERIDDVVLADGLSIRRVGLCATSAHAQAVGSAADIDEDPAPRATYELLERIALAEAASDPGRDFPVLTTSGEQQGVIAFESVFPPSDAPEVWAFARSSGVSLHTDWQLACASASRELVERDRLLRAWLGETRPVEIDHGGLASAFGGTSSYDWREASFPPARSCPIGGDVEVVGTYGFPKGTGLPLVFGFGARMSREEAVRAARREALQLLAFLWGESIPDNPPEPLPLPMTHLETYQVRDRQVVLRHWLAKGHAAHHRANETPETTGERSVRFVDLTPPSLRGRLRVAKALCPAAIPLTFGRSPLLAHLPPELRIHPIP